MLFEQLVVNGLGIVGDILHAEHDSEWDLMAIQCFDRLRQGLGRGRGMNGPEHDAGLLLVALAITHAGHSGVGRVHAERLGHAVELVIGHRGHHHVPVGEGDGPLVGRERLGKVTLVVVQRDLVSGRVGEQEGHRGVQHRQLDVLAACAPLAGEERGGDGLGGGVGGDLVRRGLAKEPGGFVVDARLVADEPRLGLDHRVVHPPVGVGAVGAEPGERGVDDAGVASRDVAVAETESFDHPRAHVLHEHVGAGGEVEHDVATLRVGAVHRDGTLTPVAHLEQGRDPARRHAHITALVPESGLLHLDGLGALVDQEGHRQRAGDGHAHLHDAYAVKGSGHRVSWILVQVVRIAEKLHTTPPM